MNASHGARRLIKSNLQKYHGGRLLRDNEDDLSQAGDIRLHSSSKPGLLEGTTYRASFAQTIAFPDPTNSWIATQKVYSSQKTFKVLGCKYTLDPIFVDSVYPPQGHSDFFSRVPETCVQTQKLTLTQMCSRTYLSTMNMSHG